MSDSFRIIPDAVCIVLDATGVPTGGLLILIVVNNLKSQATTHFMTGSTVYTYHIPTVYHPGWKISKTRNNITGGVVYTAILYLVPGTVYLFLRFFWTFSLISLRTRTVRTSAKEVNTTEADRLDTLVEIWARPVQCFARGVLLKLFFRRE